MSTLIKDVMSKPVVSVGADIALSQAKKMMYEHGIRHLPVLERGSLVGLLSDRDIKLCYAVDGAKADTLKASDACSSEVFAVEPNDKLSFVCKRMFEESLGSAVVVEGERAIGIFTVTDACRLLAEQG